ncbi:hypothetical protein NPIL_411731 [Nephila pilipes]|uniref:Uncharacterized protein n=1 Tax=Nephila pilipes TaxID=299642 RepID=A0A8X6IL75_NEPPI|nr:hypothetical protein NPIL_411731 [Nephila pilipes]
MASFGHRLASLLRRQRVLFSNRDSLQSTRFVSHSQRPWNTSLWSWTNMCSSFCRTSRPPMGHNEPLNGHVKYVTERKSTLKYFAYTRELR